MTPEPTETDFNTLWARIKARHDAKHGEGDAERLARDGMRRFGAFSRIEPDPLGCPYHPPGRCLNCTCARRPTSTEGGK